MASSIQYIFHNTPFNKAMTKNNITLGILVLCVFSDVRLYGVFGNLGGHALFASLFQLKDLWHNDVIITQILERIAEKCENPPVSITM